MTDDPTREKLELADRLERRLNGRCVTIDGDLYRDISDAVVALRASVPADAKCICDTDHPTFKERGHHPLCPANVPAERKMVPEIPFDPTNHHNALKCPYCNPKGLVLARPLPPSNPVRESRWRTDFENAPSPCIGWCVFPAGEEARQIWHWPGTTDRWSSHGMQQTVKAWQPLPALAALAPAQEKVQRFDISAESELTKLAAECHRAKWQFDINDEQKISVAAATGLATRAFQELHRIGDMALKARDAFAVSRPERATKEN
jgi:hypothetical protein